LTPFANLILTPLMTGSGSRTIGRCSNDRDLLVVTGRLLVKLS
jgi:hypothetical protein